MGILNVELQTSEYSTGSLWPVYRSGDIVRGRVTYQIQKDREDISGIELYLVGEISMRSIDDATIERSRAYEGMFAGDFLLPRDRTVTSGRHMLFLRKTTLFNGPYTATRQIMEFPFEFAFPKVGDNLSFAASTETNGLAVAQQKSVDALPPSMTWRIREKGKQSVDTVCVSYSLEARTTDLAIVKEIQIEHPPRESVVPPPQPSLSTRSFNAVTWSNRHLSSTKTPLSHRFGRMLHSSSPYHQTPSISFTPRIKFAEALHCWQEVPISISISDCTMTDHASPVHLDLVLLRINLMTYRGAMNARVTSSATQNAGVFEINQETEIPIDGTWVNVARDFKLSDMIGVKSGTVPDLEILHLKYRHAVGVRTDIKHRETGHVFKVETEFPIRVLAPYSGKDKGTEHSAVNRREVNDDVPPPAYESDDDFGNKHS